MRNIKAQQKATQREVVRQKKRKSTDFYTNEGKNNTDKTKISPF